MKTCPKKDIETWQKLLVMVDDASMFLGLHGAHEATADETVDGLEAWGAYFGIPSTWVTDGGSHFNNTVIDELKRRYGAVHHIVVAYSPWANGTVENMMRKLLKVFRVLLAEFRMEEKEWPSLVKMVQSVLNHSPSARLDGETPFRVMTGLKTKNAINSIIHPRHIHEVCKIEDVWDKVKESFSDLEQARDELHQRVKAAGDAKRAAGREAHNAKKNVKFPNIQVGNFVLVGREAVVSGQKLRVTWRGPRQITAIKSPWICEVEDLVNKRRKEVHISRIRLYSEGQLDVTDELRLQAAHNERNLEVEKFLGVHRDVASGEWQVHVLWRGFEASESSWEPMLAMADDVPAKLRQYLKGAGKSQPQTPGAIAVLKRRKLWKD